MSARIDFIPRLDSDNRGVSGVIDPKRLGLATEVICGRTKLTRFDSIGTEMGVTEDAILKIGRVLARKYPDTDRREVKDAATDFVTNGLKLVLSPSEDVRRGENDPFMFVPGRGGRDPLLPSRNLLEPGMRTAAYKIRQPMGQASWVEPNATRLLQKAGYEVEEKENGAHYYGIAWGYDIPETWEANILNEDLLGERQSAANYALDDFRERVCGIGDTLKKLPGFFTCGDALYVLGGSRFSLGSVTAVQMLQRIAYFEHTFMRANGERAPMALVAPTADKIAMTTTFFGEGQEGPSVWTRALEQFPWLAKVTWTNRLNTAGATGGPRWVIYLAERNELYFEHTETMLFGPFEEIMSLTFVQLRRHGGLIAKMPERLMYVDFA